MTEYTHLKGLPFFEQAAPKKKGGFHATRISHSKPLQRLLAFLFRRYPGGASTREIIVACEICAVNSVAASLSAIMNGPISYDCAQERLTANGAAVYLYKLSNPWAAAKSVRLLVPLERMIPELAYEITRFPE